MFIILEGPDGAGKSTFIQKLYRSLWDIGRGTTLINPKRSPRQGVLVEYMINLDFYNPGSGIDLVLDRCWYSDEVYGPHWRGKGLDPADRRRLDRWASAKGAVVARLDADDDVLIARLLERGDEDVAPEDVVLYAREYREQSSSWSLPTTINPTVEQIIDFALIRETQCTTS